MVGLWFVARLHAMPAKIDVPFCASCGESATEQAPVAALKSVMAPYCSECAARAREREWQTPLVLVGVCGVLGFVLPLCPWMTVEAAADLALVIAFFAAIFAVGWLSIRGRSETKASASGAAVRAHKLRPYIEFDCARRDVAHALVAACGGAVKPRRALRLSPAVTVVPLAVLATGFGFAGMGALFTTTLQIDNGGEKPTTVLLDGRALDRVSAGQHHEVSVRTGAHRLRWNVENDWRERQLDFDLHHQVLLSPGPAACYLKEVGVYRPEDVNKPLTPEEAQEAAKAGPLPFAELFILPKVTHWFEPLPEKKPADALESNVDVGIEREGICTKLVRRGCDSAAIAAFLQCESGASTREALESCLRSVESFCGSP